MNSYIRILLLCSLAFTLTMLGACSEDLVKPQSESFTSDLSMVETATVENADHTSYAGVIAGTNRYEILVPADWNGELVLYAHGFVDSYEPLELPDKDNIEEIRDEIVGMGFAFAYCSFRENGLAVKDGSRSTRQVLQIFRSKVKVEPTYTWLMGHSLGGLVAVDLVEKHPAEFDGVLTVAGMIGGTKAEFDYVGDVRNLFGLMYPAVDLPGSVCEPALITDFNSQVIMPIMGAVMADPNGVGVIASLLPLPGVDGNQFVESVITAIAFNYRGLPDILERTGGDCPYDNCDRVYTERFPLPPGTADYVNATVPRYCRSIPTENFVERYYEPNGRLQVEMITLHLAHDPIVPVFHEQLYAAKVAQAGSSHLLEQRVINGYGHTVEIATSDVVQALRDLRSKVVPAAKEFTQ